MEDESKYGHIQFEYVYKGDEFGGRPRKVVFSIPTPDMSMDELVQEFEYFLKAVGYHFKEGQHIGYEYDDSMNQKELAEVKTFDNAFAAHEEQMSNEIFNIEAGNSSLMSESLRKSAD